VLYSIDAGFVAIVKSCRIMLNGVHSGFVGLNILCYWFRNKRVKKFRCCHWNFLMTAYEIFQPLPPSLFISRAKLVFNSVSYSKLVRNIHDVCHFQTKTFSPSTDSTQPDHFLRHKEEPAYYPVLFYCFTWAFRPVFNFLQPTGYMMHHQFNIQQLYALPTLYLCVLYLSQNKQRLVPLTA